MEEESSSDSETEEGEKSGAGAQIMPPGTMAPPSKTVETSSLANAVSANKSMQPPLPPVPDKVIVKKGYNPKQGKLC